MKALVGVVIGALIVVLLILGVMYVQEENNSGVELGNDEGRLYFGITDDTADIQAVSEIEMEIEEIEVYNQAEGWTTVSSDSRTYPLLTLKANGKVELHSVEAVAAGTYNQIRIRLDDIVVHNTTEGEMRATLPSEEIIFDVNVVVEEGVDSHVTLDFLADQSLHTTTDGEYVFVPVVAIESRSSAVVEIEEDNAVTVSGGSVDADTTIGVDLDGTARAGFVLDSSAGLEVESSLLGSDNVTFMLGGRTYGDVSEDSEEESEDDASVDADVSGDAETDAGVELQL